MRSGHFLETPAPHTPTQSQSIKNHPNNLHRSASVPLILFPSLERNGSSWGSPIGTEGGVTTVKRALPCRFITHWGGVKFYSKLCGLALCRQPTHPRAFLLACHFWCPRSLTLPSPADAVGARMHSEKVLALEMLCHNGHKSNVLFYGRLEYIGMAGVVIWLWVGVILIFTIMFFVLAFKLIQPQPWWGLKRLCRGVTYLIHCIRTFKQS